MELNINGNVQSGTLLTFDNLNVSNKGVGNLTLSGAAQGATISNTGLGCLKAGNFAVQTIDLKNSRIDSAEINAIKSVKVSSTGMGSVRNRSASPMPKRKAQ